MSAPLAAVASPKNDGENALAALLAAAAASMQYHQQKQQSQNHQKSQLQLQLSLQKSQQQQQVSRQQIKLQNHQQQSRLAFNGAQQTHRAKQVASTKEGIEAAVSSNLKQNGTTKVSRDTNGIMACILDKTKGKTDVQSFIQDELEAKRDRLCQLLKLKPIQVIETLPKEIPKTVTDAGQISPIELRNLETWHDDDEKQLDESFYRELVDPSNPNGWSADEMFKYNEKMHKISSSYDDRAHTKSYTTPLPKHQSRHASKIATRLAKEIEDKALIDGRVTPESSDDDELFETERERRVKLRQISHYNQIRTRRHSQSNKSPNNQKGSVLSRKNNQSSYQNSNSTETPPAASLSSSPTLNDHPMIKPVTSSSRNILRACLA